MVAYIYVIKICLMNLVKVYTRVACLVSCLMLLLCVTPAHGQNCEARFDYEVNGLEVEFYNHSDSLQLNYFWSFGDGQTDNHRNPFPHRYQNPGEYVVTLSISNPNTFCSDIDTQRVCVQCVFPGDANHDGIVNNNDVLYLGLAFGE